MKKLLFLFCTAAGILSYSCDSSDSNANGSGNYAYKVRMTDAPAAYEQVNIDLRSVVVTGGDGQSVTLNTEAGIYNLLDLANGVNTVIATSNLNDSRVNQIRLILGPNNTIVVDGETFPLSTPSAEQSGLKLQVNQTLLADIENEILIDFDAGASIHQTGNGIYKLKPVLRTIVSAISGNIKGVVTPLSTVVMVTAESSAGVEYSSAVNSSGQFQISGLPPGSYTVTLTPALPLLPVIQTDVVVTTGSTTDLGILAIQ
ncbi:DUF4382 domain-containing protein [Flavobacterium sp.]